MSVELFIVVVIAQAVFVAGLVLLMLANRARRRLMRPERSERETGVSEAFSMWLVGAAPLHELVSRLRAIPPEDALEQTIEAVAKRAPPDRRRELQAALRREPWVARYLRQARSRIWWKRLQAARTLTIAGGPGDRAHLEHLLVDAHPAVEIAAIGAIESVADADLVAKLLADLPQRPTVVRRVLMRALVRIWPMARRVVLAGLQAPGVPPERLEAWIGLAELSADPECVVAAAAHSTHPDGSVRVAVARVLRHYYHPLVQDKLAALLRDPEWAVRASASRTAGTLGDPAALAPLRAACSDSAWWVRFRASLAIAQLGEPGRAVLRELRDGTDPFARDMAMMISGLSDGGVLELAET